MERSCGGWWWSGAGRAGGEGVEWMRVSNLYHGENMVNGNAEKQGWCPALLGEPARRHPCRSVLIRGQRRIPPGARKRAPLSWSGGWAGFDRVEQHPGD